MTRIYEKKAYLPGCFLYKPFISDPKGPAQGFSRIMGEHLLAYQVNMQVNGGINGSIHSSVAIKHCKVSLFFLVLSIETEAPLWPRLMRLNVSLFWYAWSTAKTPAILGHMCLHQNAGTHHAQLAQAEVPSLCESCLAPWKPPTCICFKIATTILRGEEGKRRYEGLNKNCSALSDVSKKKSILIIKLETTNNRK